VNPGETGTLQVTMDPTRDPGFFGDVAARLDITSNDAFEPNQSIDITGTVQDPVIVLPAEVDASSNGETLTIEVPVSNDGTQTLTLDPAPVVTGTNSNLFTIDSFPATLAGGASGTIRITMDPSVDDPDFAGDPDATLEVSSNDPLVSVEYVTIVGTVTNPCIKTDARHDFGPFDNGSPVRTLQVPIWNIGDSVDLEIADGDVGITYDPLGVFALSTDLTTTMTIAPGATQNLEFTFDPTGLGGGIYTATVEIYSTDRDHSPITVELRVDLKTPGNNMIAWWPLDYGAQDASGNGHHGASREGATTGGVTYGTSGAIAGTGFAATFTPTSVVTVPFDEELNPSSFTLVAWVKPNAGGGYHSVVTSRNGEASAGGHNYGYIIYKHGSRWEYWTGSGGEEAGGWQQTRQATNDIVDNEWVHLAITYDHATQTKTLYENGVAVATTNEVVVARNLLKDFHIGGGSDTGGQYLFSGQIDDVALFNYVLAPADIQTIQTSGVAAFAGASQPGPPYGGWAGGFPGLTDTAPGVDFEGDGFDNALEYALGGDPTVMDTGEIAPTASVDADNLVFVFRRSQMAFDDPNTEILVEYGSDLLGWTPAQKGVDGVKLGGIDRDFYGSGIDRVTLLIPRALATDAKMFARLQVTVAQP
jgi:hypothetical protein